MYLPDSIAIQKYHRDRILKFGKESSRALGWTTSESQATRFEIISELLGDLTGKSILDAGCGHGDLRGYFNDKYQGLRYAGIEQVDSFLDVAVQKYGHYSDTAFYFGDFLQADIPVMDYVVACGALSYKNHDLDFIYKAIAKLFQNCRLGLVFNFLSKIESEEGILVAYQAEVILDYCKTLSTNVVFKTGYCGEDWTVKISKD